MIQYAYKGLKRIKQEIYSKECKEKGRINKQYFTRKRKMSFDRLILYILNKRGLSTNMEINNFFEKVDEEIDMVAQSVMEQRLKLNPDVFEYLNEEYLKGFYEGCRDDGVKTYKGYLLKAIDGSDFEVPNTKKSKEVYGIINSKVEKSMSRAKVSMCYDILNRYILDVEIDRYKADERKLAKKHIKREEETTKGYKAIYIMDRGYMSTELLVFLCKNDKKFLCRLNNKYYKEEIEQMKSKDETVEIEYNTGRLRRDRFEDDELRKYAKEQKRGKVRIVKCILNTGEEEYLITNIEEFNYEEMIELYNKRWSIETAYFSLKQKLQIEKFTSSNPILIEQDVLSSVLVYNMIQTMKNEAEEQIEKKKYKYEMKVNENIAIGLFKNEIIKIMIEENDDKRMEMYNKLSKKMLKYRIPIRKDRTFKRESNIYNNNSYNKLKSF